MAITRLILGINTKLKRDTRLPKNRADLDFFATLVKLLAFFFFLAYKGLNV